MINHFRLIFVVNLLLFSFSCYAMGIRSFVALPLDEGGTVLRVFGERDTDDNINNITANLAYGITGTQSLIAAIPYRISGGTGDRLGDFNLLYRHTLWQKNELGRTSRIGLLGGGAIPTEADRDRRLQIGGVFTGFWNRHEVDADFLWREGLSDTPNSARYDVSWQYRLSPVVYPDWGIPSQWNSVLELSGRWESGNEVIHFVTAGLQHIWPQCVLEGSVSQDLNGNNDTNLIFSIRYHY